MGSQYRWVNTLPDLRLSGLCRNLPRALALEPKQYFLVDRVYKLTRLHWVHGFGSLRNCLTRRTAQRSCHHFRFVYAVGGRWFSIWLAAHAARSCFSNGLRVISFQGDYSWPLVLHRFHWVLRLLSRYNHFVISENISRHAGKHQDYDRPRSPVLVHPLLFFGLLVIRMARLM